MSNPRILVADEDQSVLDSITLALREQGYEAVSARCAATLFERLEQSTPDLILLDVSLPDADGYRLLERIKADDRWRDLPVVMVSSLPPEDATVKTLGLGATDFVRKPVKVRELVARIQAHLRMRAEVLAMRDALRASEEELLRARDDAESRRKLVDILHEVAGELSSDEIYHILARRVARALNVSHCSVILARPGDVVGIVATAYENPALHHKEVPLDRYPEVRMALEKGRPVLVEDLQSHPIYADLRAVWAAEGTQITIRSVIALPFSLDRVEAGVFLLRRTLSQPPLTNDDVEFADAVIKAAVAAIQRAQIIETTKADNVRLEQLAHTDPLTQVLNRRAMTIRLAAELDRARRYNSVLTLLMIDLDHFKRINDTFGHLIGDDVLRSVASVLGNAVRSVDIVARYGGEEFVVVLPETGEQGAFVFAERIRDKIEATSFVTAGHGPLHLTASVGVACFPSAQVESVEDLFAKADEALYRAKADGRNRVRT